MQTTKLPVQKQGDRRARCLLDATYIGKLTACTLRHNNPGPWEGAHGANRGSTKYVQGRSPQGPRRAALCTSELLSSRSPNMKNNTPKSWQIQGAI